MMILMYSFFFSFFVIRTEKKCALDWTFTYFFLKEHMDKTIVCICAILGVFKCVWGIESVFFGVSVFFGMFGCVFGGRKWVFECV